MASQNPVRVLGEGLELLVDAHAIVGEGPVWSVTEQVLYWVDIMSNLVHRYDPESGSDTTFDVGQPVGALAIRASGGLALALRDGFAVLDLNTGACADARSGRGR